MQMSQLLLESSGHVLQLLNMIFGCCVASDDLVFLAEEFFNCSKLALISLKFSLKVPHRLNLLP